VVVGQRRTAQTEAQFNYRHGSLWAIPPNCQMGGPVPREIESCKWTVGE
jgi:hypothetical protein